MSLRYFLRSPFCTLLPVVVLGLTAAWLIPACSRASHETGESLPNIDSPSADTSRAQKS